MTPGSPGVSDSSERRDLPAPVSYDVCTLTPEDVFLFNEGTHLRLYDKLGAIPLLHDGVAGTHFAVWAPNAAAVSVIGDFNAWTPRMHPLRPVHSSGIWHGFIPAAGKGARYKYHIESHVQGYRCDKADPFGRYSEIAPLTASVVWNLNYEWHDQEWMQSRSRRQAMDAPISIYEVHMGSWRRRADDRFRSLHYRELADELVGYVCEMGFTHVQFLPVMEHPFFGSWGYQVTGYFAPSSRHGTPQDFMYLVDCLHQRGIGVFLDWVPAHFPHDPHGLSYFDGTHLYEHSDPRQGQHPDWRTAVFNYGRTEVAEYLLNSALFWLDRYHIDGLRVDAVASMLYLDYSREPGEWIPNRFGGNENLEALGFIRRLNETVYARYADVHMMAEESTAWPMVSRPTNVGGLGFGFKWDMGWMHDTLLYMSRDPVHRRYHHHELPFRMMYAYSENFILPLSHDEVVHGKRSLWDRMPGDEWQKFANLRLLLGYMFGQPGKKLLFMGGEFGQRDEWWHDASVHWHLLEHPSHGGIARWVHDLNQLYRREPAMHRGDVNPSGFQWIDWSDHEQSVLAYIRLGATDDAPLLVICNFTPVPRSGYRLGVPAGGAWLELLNSDSELYGGSGIGNRGSTFAEPVPAHGQPHSLRLEIPPLAALFLKPES